MKNSKTHQTRGTSLPVAMDSDVKQRLDKLKPWVPSFSAYIQRLVHLDLTYGLLAPDGGLNQEVVNKAKGKRPFDHGFSQSVIAVG